MFGMHDFHNRRRWVLVSVFVGTCRSDVLRSILPTLLGRYENLDSYRRRWANPAGRTHEFRGNTPEIKKFTENLLFFHEGNWQLSRWRLGSDLGVTGLRQTRPDRLATKRPGLPTHKPATKISPFFMVSICMNAACRIQRLFNILPSDFAKSAARFRCAVTDLPSDRRQPPTG